MLFTDLDSSDVTEDIYERTSAKHERLFFSTSNSQSDNSKDILWEVFMKKNIFGTDR